MEQLVFFGMLIFFISAVLQGLTGFGFSILAVPLITLFISPKTAVPILILYSIIINLVVLYSSRKHIDLRKIWILLIAGIAGLPLGTHLLVILDGYVLKIFIGILIMIFGTLLLLGFRRKLVYEKISMLPIGLISGILSGSISTGGPPIIIFLSNKQLEKQTFRGNLALYFLTLNVFTIPLYFFNGLFTKQVMNYSLTFLPGLIAGVIIGSLLSHKVKENHFRKLTLIILIFMGLLSIISGVR